MTNFKAKTHQIRFRLGLCPRPRWGSLQRSPDPLAGFGAHFAAGEGLGWGRGGRGKWRGGKGRAPKNYWTRAPQSLAASLNHWWPVRKWVLFVNACVFSCWVNSETTSWNTRMQDWSTAPSRFDCHTGSLWLLYNTFILLHFSVAVLT